MNYKEDLKINQFSLDKEWTKQSSLLMTYQEQAILAESKKTKLKEDIEIFDALLDSKIRKDITDGLIPKQTETAIKNTIIINNERIKKQQEYNEALKEYSLLNAAVKSFEHKKKALEYLCQLQISGYFSEPKSKTLDDLVVKNGQDKIKEKINQRIKGEE